MRLRLERAGNVMRHVLLKKPDVRRHVTLAAIGLSLVAISSCGGGASARLYTLHVPPPPRATAKPLPLVIGVEQFRAENPLADTRILRYESPTQLKYYDDDRWVSDPATLVTELAARYLARMRIVRQVRPLPWTERMDYLVQGQILNFEEVDSERGRQARVVLELTLARSPSREMVWSGTFRAEEPVKRGGVPGLVEALSAATDQVLKQASAQLDAQLSARQQNP